MCQRTHCTKTISTALPNTWVVIQNVNYTIVTISHYYRLIKYEPFIAWLISTKSHKQYILLHARGCHMRPNNTGPYPIQMYINWLHMGSSLIKSTCLIIKHWSVLVRVLYGKWRNDNPATHDNVIKWKHFPRYCTFMREIHGFTSQVAATRALMFSLMLA